MKRFLPWPIRLPVATLLLGLLVLLGLLLRLWGINWAGQSWAEPQTAGFIANQAGWHQAFPLLAGLLHVPAAWVWGVITHLLGPAGQPGPALSASLWACLVAACLGAVNIWALYRLCLAALSSRGAALVAAALLAVSPWAVAQGHLGAGGSAACLAMTFALWAGIKFYQQRHLTDYFWAGLAWGLALFTAPQAWLLLPGLLLTHILANWQRDQAWWRWLLAQPGAFGAGAALGLVPAILLRWLAGPLGSPLPTAPSLSGQLAGWLRFVGPALGWELVLLFAAGLGLAVWRRQQDLWPLAAFVLLVLAAAVLAGGVFGGEGQAALLPALLCVALFAPLWFMGRGLPKMLRPWLWAILGLVLVITPLGKSISVSYLFWQSDTRLSAQRWVQANLPPGAESQIGLSSQPSGSSAGDSPAASNKPDKFIMLSAGELAGNFSPWSGKPRDEAGRLAQRVEQEFMLLKQFGLKGGKTGQYLSGPRFPTMVSPLIRIYAARPKLTLQQPLGLSHPPVGAAASHQVLYLNQRLYSRDGAVALVSGPGRVSRVLRTARDLIGLEVEVISLAPRPLGLEIIQGPWYRRQVHLPPGGRVVQYLAPTAWPWPKQRVYPFTFQVQGQGQVFVRLVSDPLLLGRRCLERGQWQRAAAILEPMQARHPRALLPRALLAAAYLELGRAREAAALFEGQESALEQLAALVLGGSTWETWLAQFGRFGGFYPDLLQNALSRDIRLGEDRVQAEQAQGHDSLNYSRQTAASANGQGGEQRLRLRDPWPARRARARVTLSWQGPPSEKTELLGILEAAAYTTQGWRVVAQKMLTPRHLKKEPDQASFDLRLPAPQAVERWQFVLRSFGQTALKLEQVKLTLDPRDDLSRIARWAFWAQGAVMLAQGRPGPAVQVLGWLKRLQPDFVPGIVSHTKALFADGQKKAAKKSLQRALDALAGKPWHLQWAVDMLKKMGDKKLLLQYQQSLENSRNKVRNSATRP